MIYIIATVLKHKQTMVKLKNETRYIWQYTIKGVHLRIPQQARDRGCLPRDSTILNQSKNVRDNADYWIY